MQGGRFGGVAFWVKGAAALRRASVVARLSR
jgi:hypothetical protein